MFDRLCDNFFSCPFFLEGVGPGGGGGGGLPNERPRADHVITGPKRGLENNRMGRGHGDNTRTLRLLDQLGPESRVGEKILNYFLKGEPNKG